MNLKKIGRVFTSKSVGTGPSSYEKKNLPGRGLTKVEKHWSTGSLWQGAPFAICTVLILKSRIIGFEGYPERIIASSSPLMVKSAVVKSILGDNFQNSILF